MLVSFSQSETVIVLRLFVLPPLVILAHFSQVL